MTIARFVLRVAALPTLLAACSSTNGGSGKACPVTFGTTAAALTYNPAGLEMIEHAPGGAPRPRGDGTVGPSASAVVVALHGCTQTAEAYQGAGWNELADRSGFAVVYPEQTTANNGQRCFRWWDAAHNTRDQGEAKSITSMALAAKAKYGAQHVYVNGLSAGAAMGVALLAAYPDVYEAGAIMAGSRNGAPPPGRTLPVHERPQPVPDQWLFLLPAEGGANPPPFSI